MDRPAPQESGQNAYLDLSSPVSLSPFKSLIVVMTNIRRFGQCENDTLSCLTDHQRWCCHQPLCRMHATVRSAGSTVYVYVAWPYRPYWFKMWALALILGIRLDMYEKEGGK